QAGRKFDRCGDSEAARHVESAGAALHEWCDGEIRAAGFFRRDRRGHVSSGLVCNAEFERGFTARATRKGVMKLTGGEIVCESLTRLGVRHIFGYPGGAILPVYDALGKSKLHHILVRHEQGATHMADGYARATGGVGVAMATSGPGATNMVTGIATAMLD